MEILMTIVLFIVLFLMAVVMAVTPTFVRWVYQDWRAGKLKAKDRGEA